MSLVHWVILAGIVVLLFGAGRLSNVMGEFAKGIKSFKAGMRDDDPPPAPLVPPSLHATTPPPPLQQTAPPPPTQAQTVVGERVS